MATSDVVVPEDVLQKKLVDQLRAWLVAEGAWYAASFVLHTVMACSLMLVSVTVRGKMTGEAPAIESLQEDQKQAMRPRATTSRRRSLSLRRKRRKRRTRAARSRGRLNGSRFRNARVSSEGFCSLTGGMTNSTEGLTASGSCSSSSGATRLIECHGTIPLFARKTPVASVACGTEGRSRRPNRMQMT